MSSVPVEIILFKVWRPSWSWTRGQAQRRLDAKVATWELRTPALATEITLERPRNRGFTFIPD